MRFLCWLGFHKWGPMEDVRFFQEMFEAQFCIRCGCIRSKFHIEGFWK